jgi:hypothetical protein
VRDERGAGRDDAAEGEADGVLPPLRLLEALDVQFGLHRSAPMRSPTNKNAKAAANQMPHDRVAESQGGRERNDRLIAVPVDERRYDDARALDKRVRQGLEQFFVSAVLFEDKGLRIDGWQGSKAAEKMIRVAQKTYDAGSQET